MKHDDATARIGVDAVQPWTLTMSGQKLYYLDPQPEALILKDICHNLGNLCRFTGSTSRFYSIAQHSLHVGQIVKRMLDDEGVDRNVDYWDQILAALLHDSEEAYVNDLASPLKGAIRGKYQWIANSIRHAIYDKYGIDRAYHNQIVKAADNISIIIERYYLMPNHPDWPKASKAEIRQYPKLDRMSPPQSAQNLYNTVCQALVQRNALRAEIGSEAL